MICGLGYSCSWYAGSKPHILIFSSASRSCSNVVSCPKLKGWSNTWANSRATLDSTHCRLRRSIRPGRYTIIDATPRRRSPKRKLTNGRIQPLRPGPGAKTMETLSMRTSNSSSVILSATLLTAFAVFGLKSSSNQPVSIRLYHTSSHVTVCTHIIVSLPVISAIINPPSFTCR